MPYWRAVAADYFKHDVRTYDQAVDYVESFKKENETRREIMAQLGFFRGPTEAEVAMIKKWLEEYEFDIDTIKLACDETVATNKPSFRYVDAILTSWLNGQTPSQPKKRNKRNMSEGREYSEEELTKIFFGDN